MPKLAGIALCVGCTACASKCPNHCLSMRCDKDGFVYPEMIGKEQCVECHLCETVCPILNTNLIEKKKTVAFSAFSLDKHIRKNSSSGGIFTELSLAILSNNGVVYGAAYDDMFQVRHICIDTAEELARLRGAKYAESQLENSFSQILFRLKQGQPILFSGMPCQVAGLKAFLKKDYDNLFCIDFVCHGVPSPMVWKFYIKYRAKVDANGELPCNINLRSKKTGWSQYQYSNVFEYKNGKQHSSLSSQSLFMKLFLENYISRSSCSNCQFKGYSRVSDITLGDFWGIWDIDPEMDDDKGTSVVLLQSQKGKMLWDEIKDRIIFKSVTLEQASQYNQSMLHASKAKENREEILAMIREGDFAECSKLFIQNSPSFISKIKGKVDKWICKISHVR